MAEFDNKFRFAIQKLVYIYTFKENGCHQRSSQTKNQYLRSAIFDSPLVPTRGQIRRLVPNICCASLKMLQRESRELLKI